MRSRTGKGAQLIFQGFLLFLVGLQMAWLLINGYAYKLAKPEMLPVIFVFILMVLLLGAVSLYYGLKPGFKLRTSWSHTLLCFGVMVSVLLIYAPQDNSGYASAQMLKAQSSNYFFNASNDPNEVSLLETFNTETANKGMVMATKDAEGVMTITDEYFINMVDDLYIHVDDFVGQKVRIKGFALRMEGFSKDQLVVSRLIMSCCAADASAAGLMIKGPLAESFKDDDWLEVTGTIDVIEYDGDRIPVILLDSADPVEPLANKYVYYNYN